MTQVAHSPFILNIFIIDLIIIAVSLFVHERMVGNNYLYVCINYTTLSSTGCGARNAILKKFGGLFSGML